MKWIGQHIWDFVSRFRADTFFYGNVQLGASSTDYGKTISFGAGRHMVIAEVELTDANETDHGVIKQLPGIKLPQYAFIERATATITELSNLGTYDVEVGFGTNDGVAAGTAPANYHLVLGNVANVGRTDDVDAHANISIGSGTGNLKKSWWNHEKDWSAGYYTFGNGELTADHYVYVCSAGTSNGTTDGTSGKLYVSIQYFGMD